PGRRDTEFFYRWFSSDSCLSRLLFRFGSEFEVEIDTQTAGERECSGLYSRQVIRRLAELLGVDIGRMFFQHQNVIANQREGDRLEGSSLNQAGRQIIAQTQLTKFDEPGVVHEFFHKAGDVPDGSVEDTGFQGGSIR